MNKIMISAFAAFALLSTGCCLRLGENTRLGVNCCGKLDNENFVSEEKTEGSTVEVVSPTTPSKSYDAETLTGIGLTLALAGFIAWKTYKHFKGKCHLDAGEKQV